MKKPEIQTIRYFPLHEICEYVEEKLNLNYDLWEYIIENCTDNPGNGSLRYLNFSKIKIDEISDFLKNEFNCDGIEVFIEW